MDLGNGRGQDNARREQQWRISHCVGVAPDLVSGFAAILPAEEAIRFIAGESRAGEAAWVCHRYLWRVV